MNRWFIFSFPLTVFLVLLGFLITGLHRDPRDVPSPIIGKPVPEFILTQLHDPGKSISPRSLRGKVWLLNVWASWCSTCREEHPILLDLSRLGTVPIVGLDYKDNREDAVELLDGMGNPYQVSAFDADGRVGIDFGVYGVPETYVIDKRGVIRFKQTGAVSPEVVSEKLLPLIGKLNRE